MSGSLVVVDDVLSPHWLGVISGLFDYLSGGGTLIPVAVIPNKLLLTCSPVFKSAWTEFLRERYGRLLSKTGVDLLGHLVDVIDEDSTLRSCSPRLARDQSEANTGLAELEAWTIFSQSRSYKLVRAYMLLRGHSPPV
jgi:hypothetical protein